MPSILFVHENFPAQFGGIAGHLGRRGWNVVFATAAEHIPNDKRDHECIPNVHVLRYRKSREGTPGIHPYLRGTETAVLNAQGLARLAAGLDKGGFKPDIIVAHSGWGSGSLARVVWPQARFVQYLEWWYNADGADKEPNVRPISPEDSAAKTLVRNLPFLLDAQSADAILMPTQFQADQTPALLKPLIHVIHDGVNAAFYRPSQPDDAPFTAPGLPDDAPIVTYATRGMEPMRGFPQFMESWSKLQHLRPDLHCVIAGTDRVCYGAKLPEGQSFKKAMLAKFPFDMTRLHFVELLPKPAYRALLQRSDAHVYLTRPFVLSWSLIEAMLTGAPLVASDVTPVREATPPGTASHVDMDKPDEITGAICTLLDNPKQAQTQGRSAREHAVKTYAADRLWPRHEALFLSLIDQKA